MPKELNIDKLERKFASLTRSKDSIQAVSSWIMHHHEFCQEIVEHWYDALTKDQNALVMFYVANEIIQNCGKKRVPQYREAFSKVLEKAVCLEKVREIKSDVCRILTLWKERCIFGDDFFQRLENNLNASEVVPSPSVEENEDSELEIITKYKSGNLFGSLKRLKEVETEAKEKEEILSFADEPQLPELSDFTVREECFEMLKKIDSFCSIVNECLNATNNVVKARENTMKELKHSCIFYTAQHGDVKKVANAYMTYAKRLKNMERKLSEKRLVLPSPVENDSPCFSESNTQASSIVGASPFDYDTSSMSRTSSKVSPSLFNEKSHDANVDNLKSNTSFWNKISKKASSDFPKHYERELEESIEKSPTKESPKQKFSKLAELFSETKANSEKQIGPESSTLDSLPGMSNLKGLSSPNKQNSKTSDLKIATNDAPENIENSTRLSSNEEPKGILDQLTEEATNEAEKASAVENANDIDVLLEESYDTKKAKSNVSVKRKIELLLQSKGKKACTDNSKKANSDSTLTYNSSVVVPVLEGKKSSEDSLEDDSINLNNLGNTGINEKECTDLNKAIQIVSPGSKRVGKTSPDAISVVENVTSDMKKNLSLEEKIQSVSKIFMPSSNAIEQCKNIDFLTEQSDTKDSLSDKNEGSTEEISKNNLIISDQERPKEPESDDFSIQTPSSFIDSSLFSSISSISTEFLKNILDKNKNNQSMDTVNNNVTDTSLVTDSIGTGELLKSNNSENKMKIPALDFLDNVAITKENLVPSNMVTKSISQTESPVNVEKEINTKEDSDVKDTTSLDNTSIKPNDTEQQTICQEEIPDCTSTKILESVISSNDQTIFSPISGGQLKPNNQLETEKADDKPNLLSTLQNVLECISDKNLSFCDNKNVWKTTSMSLENCLNMYHVLRSADTKLDNVSNPLIAENKIISKSNAESTITSEIYNQDNFEVMDMECDSE